jgi:transcriptional regulator with XRE-family HTH domain
VKLAEDLHPADRATRRRIARQLREIREERHISQPALADLLGVHQSKIGDRENDDRWRVDTVQAWARALDHRLDMALDGVTVPDDGDPLAAVYATSQPATVAEEDRLDLRILVNDLRRIRVASRVTLAEMGRRLGCSESAVCHRESRPDGMLLATVQRYTRALGGELRVAVVSMWRETAS